MLENKILNIEAIKKWIKYEFLYKMNANEKYYKKLIKILGKLVEYYDSILDPVKIYFWEKIQYYTTEFQLILNNINKNKPKISMEQKNTIIEQEINIDIEKIKSFRQNKINFIQNKINNPVDKWLNTDLIKINHTENLKIINKNLTDQTQSLENRLKNRKKNLKNKSLMSQNTTVNKYNSILTQKSYLKTEEILINTNNNLNSDFNNK